MVIDKYLSQTEFESYQDFIENFKIKIPEKFNFAFDVVDEIASQTPDKIAMVWCNDKGEEALYTFADMKRYSDKAADFIAAEFAKSKLAFWGDSKSYFQEFTMTKTKNLELNGTLDGETLNANNTVLNTSIADLHMHGMGGYETVIVKKEDDFSKMISPLAQSKKNLLILVDTAHKNLFRRIQWVTGREKFTSAFTQVFVLTTNTAPAALNLHAKNEITEKKLKNVIGVIPRKSKKDE